MSSHYELAWNQHLSLMSVRVTQNEEISATQQRELSIVRENYTAAKEQIHQLKQQCKYVT